MPGCCLAGELALPPLLGSIVLAKQAQPWEQDLRCFGWLVCLLVVIVSLLVPGTAFNHVEKKKRKRKEISVQDKTS